MATNELDNIKEQMDGLLIQASGKGKNIAGIIVFADILTSGVVLFIYGITLISMGMLMEIGWPFLIVGSIMTVLGAIFLPLNISRLKEKIRYSNEYQTLAKEKEQLLHKEQFKPTTIKSNKPVDKNESNEDMLLRLLAEGKLSVEEYKKLRKK